MCWSPDALIVDAVHAVHALQGTPELAVVAGIFNVSSPEWWATGDGNEVVFAGDSGGARYGNGGEDLMFGGAGSDELQGGLRGWLEAANDAVFKMRRVG